MTEKYLVDRADKNFSSLDSIIADIDRFPVKVEFDRRAADKAVEVRADHFSMKTYQSLAEKHGLLPIIYYEHKKELVVGVHPNSVQLTSDQTAIHFMEFGIPFEHYLPKTYRARNINSENVVPILFQDEEYSKLFNMVIDPEIRRKYLAEKQHLESESNFNAGLDPVARNFLRQIYRNAFHSGASDIHFEWTEIGPRVRYRVNDLLRDNNTNKITFEQFRHIIGAIKVDSSNSGIRIDEHRKTQSGAFDFDEIKWGEKFAAEDLPKGYRARVSILPSIHGENLNLRLLKKGQLLTLHKLGYSSEVVSQFEDIATEPNGIIIATGPTGSGKTTTLNAILEHSNDPAQKIITLENPVEYRIHGVHQCEVSKVNNFEDIMKEILRHDPDTVMIGEIRDKTTADIAVNLALTGHLTYATLHTNDAIGTLLRLQKMGIQDYELADTFRAAFAQRLVRVLCSNCKEPDEEANINSLFRNPLYNGDVVCYKSSKKGCDKCNGTGISGRSAITEIWQVSEETKDMIGEGVVSRTKYLEQAVQKEGMRPLSMAALDYLTSGKISLEEVIRVVGKPEYHNKESILRNLVSEELRR